MLLYIYIIIYIWLLYIYIYCQFAAEFLIKGGGPTWQPQGTHRRGKKSGPLIKHCYGSPMLSTNTWICLRGSKRSHIFPIISPISGGFPVGKNTLPYNFPHFWWISRWKKHAQEHLGGPPWNPTLQGPFLWLGAIIRLFRYSTALGGPRFIIYIIIIYIYI